MGLVDTPTLTEAETSEISEESWKRKGSVSLVRCEEVAELVGAELVATEASVGVILCTLVLGGAQRFVVEVSLLPIVHTGAGSLRYPALLMLGL